MKKLNRKGFTLVELLAVIIILAIVVGISIPAVLSTVSGARAKAFQTAADTSADWIERQYQLYSVDSSSQGMNSTLKGSTYFGVAANSGYKSFTIDANDTNATKKANDLKLIEASGLKTTNVSKIEVKINSSSGRVCVRLTGVSSGDYGSSGTKTGGACNGVTF